MGHLLTRQRRSQQGVDLVDAHVEDRGDGKVLEEVVDADRGRQRERAREQRAAES